MTAIQPAGLSRKPLWHVYVSDADGRRYYRGSRCTEARAHEWCGELLDWDKVEQVWVEAWPKHCDTVMPPSPSGWLISPPALPELRRIAIHEAGHAVAAIQLGLDGQDFGALTIEPKDYMNGRFEMREIRCHEEGRLRDMVVNCAGYAALRTLGLPEDYASLGCGNDFEKAEHLIHAWGLAPIDHWKEVARALLALPDNLRAVEALADELLKAKTLQADEVEICIYNSLGL